MCHWHHPSLVLEQPQKRHFPLICLQRLILWRIRWKNLKDPRATSTVPALVLWETLLHLYLVLPFWWLFLHDGGNGVSKWWANMGLLTCFPASAGHQVQEPPPAKKDSPPYIKRGETEELKFKWCWKSQFSYSPHPEVSKLLKHLNSWP